MSKEKPATLQIEDGDIKPSAPRASYGNEKGDQYSPTTEKVDPHDKISPADDAVTVIEGFHTDITPEQRQKVLEQYGRKAEADDIAPSNDIAVILDRIIEMSEEDALNIIGQAINYHSDDPNFPSITMDKLKLLSQGYKSAEMEPNDWLFDLKAEAAMLHYHSPYPEVRSVTDPFDDPDQPCETPRAYLLGLIFMAGATALNTFFSPRQPAISIGAIVLQLLLAPCGKFLAKVLPNYAWTVPAKVPLLGGAKMATNPGPWSYKEQTLATIMFTIASGVGGTYYVYLVQILPQYLNQTWVTFGYEILLALSCQLLGFGFAGLLRRFVVFPVTAIWPKVLPTLALNRALLLPERKGENINGWKFTRYQFFMLCFGLMFVYFWIPNTLFTALRLFNWMTWIAPNNFTLGMITGSYGGMGFNPISTFDWNTAGTTALVTPFFSTLQQYIARVLSGLVIIGMYWGNYYWSAYMPINSNESFDNTGQKYNVSRIMGDNGYINLDAYKQYGPPFFSGANVFGQGAWFAWYSMALFYICIRNWTSLVNTGKGMWISLRRGTSIYDGFDDAHTRMIEKYKETPEWWFLLVLLLSFVFGVAALEAWPTHTPWWSLLTVIALNGVFLVPAALMVAAANVTLSTGVLFQMLAGIWFAGNPQAQIIMQAFASNFQHQADNYISDQKLAHYAKLPPRAIFRAQMLAVVLNCFIFIGLLNWMISNFNQGTLCTWENAQRFVCTDAVLYYASAVQYGAFGVRNFFKLYPILPFCFLIGALIGISWACAQKYGPDIRLYAQKKLSEQKYEVLDKYVFGPLSGLAWFSPPVFWSGALNWTGGNNLTYATGGLYMSFIFMYYVKRRYGAWWEKYNYLVEAGFDVGVAISAIIQTLIFAFSNNGNGITLDWWGNTVATQGQDYLSYVQNATLLPIPSKGYFGPSPADYPMDWGGSLPQ